MADDERLFWLDLETTGHDPGRDRVLRVAALVTDARLEIRGEGLAFGVRAEDPERPAAGPSGAAGEARGAAGPGEARTIAQAEERLLGLARLHCQKGAAPLAGLCVHRERRFVTRQMPRLAEHLHYRMIDVRTLEELAWRWYPETEPRAARALGGPGTMERLVAELERLRGYRARLFRPAS